MNDEGTAVIQLLAALAQGEDVVWLENSHVGDCYVNECARKKMLNPSFFNREYSFQAHPRASARTLSLAEFARYHPHFICHGCWAYIENHE
jgi:hypothetical protein